MHSSPLVRASILFALLAMAPHIRAQETTAFLTSRPRPDAKAVVPIKVSYVNFATAGQRRRVVLANGVTVYLNQKSQFTYRATDEILLQEGEAFIDVRGNGRQAEKWPKIPWPIPWPTTGYFGRL